MVEELPPHLLELCQVWTRDELCQGVSSSPPPAPPSEGCLFPSEMKNGRATMINRQQGDPQIRRQNKELTWFANMREHLVPSSGSAVILRISCSIGVMPLKVRCPREKRWEKHFLFFWLVYVWWHFELWETSSNLFHQRSSQHAWTSALLVRTSCPVGWRTDLLRSREVLSLDAVLHWHLLVTAAFISPLWAPLIYHFPRTPAAHWVPWSQSCPRWPCCPDTETSSPLQGRWGGSPCSTPGGT